MKTYLVRVGDTFERISTINYGVPSEVSLIRGANPQVSGGLVAGMTLTIPDSPLLAAVTPDVVAARENEVSVKVGGEPFRFWSGMTINLSMTKFDQFALRAPFESGRQAFADAFVPLAFQSAQVFVGGELLYTGANYSNQPSATIEANTVTAEGYALAGVLADCPASGTSFPIEYDFLTLQDIAIEQARPFGLVPIFTADAGAAFDRVAMSAGEKVLTFWSKLALQRKLVISNDAEGQPVFQQETDEPAPDLLEFGVSPVVRITPELNPQQYFSHVTVVTPSFVGVDGTQHTIENPFLKGVFRPLVFNAGDILPGDEVDIANAQMGRMFANAIAYRVDVAGWRRANGKLWAPNTRVRLLGPQAQIRTETEFLIREVTLTRDAESDATSLLCVLPGGFSGRIPETLPWLE